MWYSYRPVPYGCRGMGQPLTNQNASEAGHSCVDNCCPPGRRHSNGPRAVNVLDAKLDVDGRTGCIRYLSPAGDHHVVSRNVCLPSYSAPTKIAGGIDYNHVVPAFDSVIFRRLIVVRTTEGNATTTGDPSQQHLRLLFHQTSDFRRAQAFGVRRPDAAFLVFVLAPTIYDVASVVPLKH